MSLPPDYRALELIGAPVWIFDIDRRRVHWANSAALRIWSAASLDELCTRDMGADMSESVARRLAQYQADFLGHGAVFHEQWTLYPGGKPVSLDVTFTGHRLADGRMAMLCEARETVQATPEALRSVEALLHTAVMITLYDMQGVPLYRNPAAREMVRSPGERLCERFTEPTAHAQLMQQLAAGEVATLTQPVHTVAGVRWHEVSARKCRDAVSGDAAILLSEVDVTLLKESEAQASYLAVHDALTGLPNRNQVKLHFAQAMRELRASGGQAALVLIDLDHFKNVNDALGHAVGDELLVEVAQRLRASVRRVDLVARFGGDEFLLLVSSHDIEAEVSRIDARIRATVSAPIAMAGTMVRVTATLGAALFPRDGSDFETLLRRADLAMYAAKEEGRNTLAYYDDAMGRALRARTELEHDLRTAIEQEAFEVHYQPRVCVASNRILGAEALVRWRHPVRGMIPPDQFIPLCESTGLIRDLGRQVFASAARQVARWSQAGFDIAVSVNVSPREFSHDGLVEGMRAAMAESGCNPARLQVEITESMLLGQDERPLRTLHAIAALGLGIALDDFGTGYSNLAYLHRYPIQTLKIDRSFIHGLAENRPLAELIVQLCGLMKLSAVAEGVETPEQLRWVAERGIAEYQGFLFSRPLPAAEFEALLRERARRPAAAC
jgi:diguanylate cyclase (GGDEF)-like protein